MTAYHHLTPYECEDNFFSRIGQEWMLVTAKHPETGSFNTMTASWGGTGILWGKPVAFAFIRPQRYTFPFIEAADTLTLSFYPESMRDALTYCGRFSGRDHDKVTACGFHPEADEDGMVWFSEAHTVLKCRKLYAEFLKETAFQSEAALSNYPQKDFHKMYICEITDILKK